MFRLIENVCTPTLVNVSQLTYDCCAFPSDLFKYQLRSFILMTLFWAWRFRQFIEDAGFHRINLQRTERECLKRQTTTTSAWELVALLTIIFSWRLNRMSAMSRVAIGIKSNSPSVHQSQSNMGKSARELQLSSKSLSSFRPFFVGESLESESKPPRATVDQPDSLYNQVMWPNVNQRSHFDQCIYKRTESEWKENTNRKADNIPQQKRPGTKHSTTTDFPGLSDCCINIAIDHGNHGNHLHSQFQPSRSYAAVHLKTDVLTDVHCVQNWFE